MVQYNLLAACTYIAHALRWRLVATKATKLSLPQLLSDCAGDFFGYVLMYTVKSIIGNFHV